MRPERHKTVRLWRDVPGRLQLEALEARAVPALVVLPIAAVEDVPLNSRIAEFLATDVKEPASAAATVDWGDGRSGPASVVLLPGGKYGVVASTTFPNPGTFAVKVTVNGAEGSTQTAAGEAVVRLGSLIPTATAIQPQVGQPFQGATATFSDTTADAKASDYSATVRWGGTDSPPTAATVEQVSPGNFRVVGAYTYAAAGPQFVVTRIERVRDKVAVETTSAAQVAPALRSTTPSPATATAGSLFIGPLVRFGSAPTSGAASDYRATIDWGDGKVSPGTIVATAATESSPAYLTVHGTHTYAVPDEYTATIRLVQPAGGEPMTASVPMTVYAFTGGLDAGSLLGTAAGVSVTNQAMPVVSGTAEPGAIVSLSMRRLGGGDPVGLANVIADASGRWSQTIGPVNGAFLLYGVSTPAGGTPSPTTPLNGGRPIAVELHPVRLLAGRRSGADRVTVTYQTSDGATPVGLTSPGSYSVRLADGRPVGAISAQASAPRGRSATRDLVLTFPRGTFSRREAATLAVSFAGAQDSNGTSADPILLAVRLGRR